MKDLKNLPAPLWKRFLAYLVDSLIISIFVETSFFTLSKEAFGTSIVPENFLLASLISLVIAILTLTYWSVLEYKLKQTIGKMLFGIEVVSENKQLTFSQILLRNIPKLAFLLLILDSLALLGKPYYKRFTEKWSQTHVIEKKR